MDDVRDVEVIAARARREWRERMLGWWLVVGKVRERREVGSSVN